MADAFSDRNPGLTSPASKAAAITPHDTNELAATTRGLYVGTGGDLVVVLAGDSVAVTFVAVPSGSLLPIRAKIVKSTDTTADDIVGLS